MNVRLSYNIEFLASAVVNSNFICNHYYVNLDMTTVTYDSIEQNIALERIKFLTEHELTNSVFASIDDIEHVLQLQQAGLKTIVLPDQAVDQIIGLMLYAKLNAICEERILINQVTISSDAGQQMRYLHDEHEDLGPFEEMGWWHTPDSTCFDRNSNAGKIIDLQNNFNWHSVNLHWEAEPIIDSQLDSNVLSFNKTDD